jgi:translation initiation factor 4G
MSPGRAQPLQLQSASQGDPDSMNNGTRTSKLPASLEMEPLAPLAGSADACISFYDHRSFELDSAGLLCPNVEALLDKLTLARLSPISDQLLAWANSSEKERYAQTVQFVIRAIYEHALNNAWRSELYAALCKMMMERISPKVQDITIKNAEGEAIAGGQLVRRYLLQWCQEDFERGWIVREAPAAAEGTTAIENPLAEARGKGEVALFLSKYYPAQKAKRRGWGLIKFIGEMFKVQMLTERIVHECVEKLLGNAQNPEEEGIESLCKLLSTVGKLLDTSKARSYMDIYFTRMKELCKNSKISTRMQSMLQVRLLPPVPNFFSLI